LAALEAELTQQQSLYEKHKANWQHELDNFIAAQHRASQVYSDQTKEGERRYQDLRRQLNEKNTRVADLERRLAWVLGENDAILEAREEFTQTQAFVMARDQIQEHEELLKKRAERLVEEAREEALQQISETKEASTSDVALLQEELGRLRAEVAESQSQTEQELAKELEVALQEATEVKLNSQIAVEVQSSCVCIRSFLLLSHPWYMYRRTSWHQPGVEWRRRGTSRLFVRPLSPRVKPWQRVLPRT